MSRAEVLAFIADTVARELDLTQPITFDSRLSGDLDLDSMGLTVVAVAVENRFRIKLDEADAGQLETAGDLVNLVLRRISEKEAVC